MLKRLIVLVAVLAVVFVFPSTSSAQQGTPSPTECAALTNATKLQACLDALGAEGGLGVPDECTRFIGEDGDLLDPDLNLLDPTLSLLGCLAAIARLDQPEPEPEPEPAAAAYDEGYGYDIGYDIGYDEGVPPEGGVDSGFGPTGSDASGAPLVARGAALLAVMGALGTGLLIMRRRHGS